MILLLYLLEITASVITEVVATTLQTLVSSISQIWSHSLCGFTFLLGEGKVVDLAISLIGGAGGAYLGFRYAQKLYPSQRKYDRASQDRSYATIIKEDLSTLLPDLEKLYIAVEDMKKNHNITPAFDTLADICHNFDRTVFQACVTAGSVDIINSAPIRSLYSSLGYIVDHESELWNTLRNNYGDPYKKDVDDLAYRTQKIYATAIDAIEALGKVIDRNNTYCRKFESSSLLSISNNKNLPRRIRERNPHP